jgi:hypothetical protein
MRAGHCWRREDRQELSSQRRLSCVSELNSICRPGSADERGQGERGVVVSLRDHHRHLAMMLAGRRDSDFHVVAESGEELDQAADREISGAVAC